ncbi:MAG: cytochrome c peroxidase [bacterium]
MRHTVAVGLVVALGLGCDAPGGPPREPDPRQDAEKIQDFGRPDATVGAPRDAGPDAWPPADAARDVRAKDAAAASRAAASAGAASRAPADALADALPDAAPADAALPDAAAPDAAPPFGGFDGPTIARLLTLGAAPPPPDPTNRVADDPVAARLGQRLFYRPSLSPLRRDCAFCHPPESAFSGQLSYDGAGGIHFRNAPSLLNVAFQPWFFWDGHADSAWAQVVGPLEDPEEMAGDRVSLARAIAEDAALAADYTALFGPPPAFDDAVPPRARPGDDALGAAWRAMTDDQRAAADLVLVNAGKALAAFERRLLSFDAPFDRYLAALAARDADGLAALTDSARRGLALFVGDAGCVACHRGPALSDGDFHDIGLPPIAGRPVDPGRSGALADVRADPRNAAGRYSDDPAGDRALRLGDLDFDLGTPGRFKTPTLRNVALTGPWGHDGRFPSLEAIVRFKTGPAQTPTRDILLADLALDDGQVADLVAFLESLTGAPVDPALVGPGTEGGQNVARTMRGMARPVASSSPTSTAVMAAVPPVISGARKLTAVCWSARTVTVFVSSTLVWPPPPAETLTVASPVGTRVTSTRSV